MNLFYRFTDYFMDFNKVRTFQEWCGVKEAKIQAEPSKVGNGISNGSSETAKCNSYYDDIRKSSTGNGVHYRGSYFNEKTAKTAVKLTPEEYEKTYEIHNWFLFYMFKFGSTLGHEIFYITFIPYVFWNVDPFIGRKMCVVWVVTMYIGQALKDIIQWPRPTWPPVFKLETRVEAEYGIPSTHAVAGTALPFTFLIAMYSRYDFSLEIGILMACSWCCLVAFSRLYVGMHSILDVMAGIALAATYLVLGWQFMDMVEVYTMTSKYAPWIIILSHFLLGVFYPSTEHYSTSRGDTVIILAAGAGIHVGSWLLYQYGLDYGPKDAQIVVFPTFFSLGMSLTRSFVGFIVMFLIRLLVKSISLSLVCFTVGVSKNDPLARRRKDVEITYKFITYTVVGLAASAIVPYFLDYLSLTH